MTSRQHLADLLNAAKSSGATTVDLGSTVITVADGLGGCVALDSTAISLSYDNVNGTFTLKRQTRGHDTIHVEHFDHRLVGDLNRWLQTMWAMDLRGIPAFDALGWPMRGCGHYQRYYTDTTALDTCINVVKDLSHENEMLATTYTTETTSLLGSTFLSFSESSPRILRFITDRGDSTIVPTDTIRRLANGFLMIKLPGCDSFSLKWSATTRAYTDGCGFGVNDFAEWRVDINGANVWRFFTGNPSDTDRTNWNFLNYNESTNNFDYYHPDTSRWMSVDPDTVSSYSYGAFDIDSSGYLTFSLYHGTYRTYYYHYRICRLISTITIPDSCSITFCGGGSFQIDPATGRLIYTITGGSCGAPCTSFSVPCLEFCDAIVPEATTIKGAIAVGVTTFTDQWPNPAGFPENIYDFAGGTNPDGSARSGPRVHGNDFERAYRGKWRPQSGFIYQTGPVQGTGLFGDANQRTYLDAGVFQFTQFNWQDLTQNDTTRWIRATTTTTYSPHGDAMEERDALGIRSAAWYDSDLNLPILVAANAGYQTVRFNSFERETAQTSSVVAHAGSRSLKIDPSGTGVGLSAVGIDAQCLTNGMLLEFWARRRYFNLLDNQMPVTVKLTAAGRTVGTYTAYNKIAQTGDWALYSVETHDFIPVDTADGGMLDVDFTNTFVKDTVWIDDIRIQPFDAEMQCFVYDPSMKRLIAAFDDQHFGTYYQYNGEGQLVRKIQETERGMKTVEEHQYHIPLADRLPEYSGKAGRRSVGNSGFSSRPQSLSVDPRADGGEPSGASAGGKFNLLDVTIDRNGVSVEGPRLDSAFDIPELPAFSAIDSSLANGTNLNVPESWNVEKYGVLKEIDSLNHAADRIRKDAEGLNASSEKKQAEDRLAAIDARKKELLSNIDLSDEEAQHLIEQIRSKVEGKDIHIEK